jgi:hypothetical protein
VCSSDLYYTASATAGAWGYSDEGISSRTLSDGSYDGFVYGGSTYDSETWELTSADPILGTENTPTTANFANATQVNAVPEPGSLALVIAGAGVVLTLRRTLRKS